MKKSVLNQIVILSIASSCVFATAAAQQSQSIAQRDAANPIAQSLTGATAAVRTQLQAQRSAITVAVADFDRDGTVDLITGYAVGDGGMMSFQRGNAAATAPTGADWDAYVHGNPAAPFQTAGTAIALPVRPDFLQTADINGDGAIDVVVAQRGGTSAYVLLGNGKGGFLAPSAIAMGGTVSALTTMRAPDASSYLVAGVCGASCSLRFIDKDGATHNSLALPGSATSVVIAALNGSGYEDLAVVSGGKVLLFDGAALSRGQVSIDTLPIQNASAIATGNFVYDRRGFPQMAVVDANGSLHVLARSGLDSTVVTSDYKVAMMKKIAAWKASQYAPALNPYASSPVLRAGQPWAEVQTLSHIAPPAEAETPIVLVHGRFSGSGIDDLAIASRGTFVKVVNASQTDGVKRTAKPAVASSAGSSNTVLSAVTARISPAAQHGTIVADGRAQPYVSVPNTHTTYTVNTTADGAPGSSCSTTCSLRTAINLANADASVTGANGLSAVDVINVPAGTYTLSFNQGNDSVGDLGYRLPVDAGVNIVGTPGSTIIDANNLDKVMSFNEGFKNAPGSFDIFLSGLTLQNGTNHNSGAGSGAITSGGIADWDNNGTGNLTFTNCILTTGKTPLGNGGIIAATNFNNAAGAGTLDIENTTVTAGQTPEQGGGIFVAANVGFTLNNSTVSGNVAEDSVNPGDSGPAGGGGVIGSGGGIEVYNRNTYPQHLTKSNVTFTNSTITGNTAQGANSSLGEGGGIEIVSAFTMSGTKITGNTAPQRSGGMDVDIINGDGTSSIADSTFTGNTTTAPGGSGAAIYMDADTESTNKLSVTYSRFHGNTSPANTTPPSANTTNGAIDVHGTGSSGGTITATDDWWGCNGAATGTGCDSGATDGTGSTFTATPYTTLQFTANPTAPSGSAAFTFTAGTAQDSSGNAYSGSQDNALAGVPATLVITQHDSTATSSSATALDSTDTISTTATPSTSANAPGAGTAVVTVDGFSLSKAFTLNESDLTVISTHTGNFTAGGTFAYTITVNNIGNATTSGSFQMIDTLPTGFTIASVYTGSGWNCSASTITVANCTDSNTVAGGSSSTNIVINGNVASTDVGTYTNSATVSGASEIDTANDTGTDTTVVIGGATFTAAFTNNTVTVNGNLVINFSITNPNSSTSLTGLAFTDALPTGTVVASESGTCGGGTITATTGTSTVSLTGATLAGGASCSFTVTVTGTVVGSYINSPGSVSSTSGPSSTAPTYPYTIGDSIWVLDANSSAVRVNVAGTATNTAGSATGTSTKGGVAFDNTGNVWVVVSGFTEVVTYSKTGSVLSTVTTGGVNNPVGVAIDGAGSAWIANGNNTLSVVSSAFAAVTPSTGYQNGTGAISTPTGIAIDNAGAVWVVSGSNAVTKILGGAAPATIPLVTGATTTTLGARP